MKTTDARQHWDSKYDEGLPSLEQPDPFFLGAYDQCIVGTERESSRALDLAGSLGRHALWLSQRSWAACVVDISEVAIRSLEAKAAHQGLTVELVVAGVATFGFGEKKFDLIVMYYHFDRGVCADVVRALKPAGLLIVKSSVAWQLYQ